MRASWLGRAVPKATGHSLELRQQGCVAQVEVGESGPQSDLADAGGFLGFQFRHFLLGSFESRDGCRPALTGLWPCHAYLPSGCPLPCPKHGGDS